ncbi:hypothetical protein FBZ89_101168 [Nitrospirillum amazonense]|uniref:Uncharacterized protein n=1 Tax=Nitrospirillum amazonense TaxID=28077 RepID=A0A560FSG6_9PROT|nr:hypothetical protein FBZ89_101168 [Nitrospirillum amazonense]
MAEIDAAKFPNELVDVRLPGKMRQPLRLEDELAELPSPFLLKLGGMGADLALDIVQLEQRGGDRTASGQASSPRPTEPMVHDGNEARQPFGRKHGRTDDDARGGLRHLIEQIDLELLL